VGVYSRVDRLLMLFGCGFTIDIANPVATS
jgi:hypothetical protein